MSPPCRRSEDSTGSWESSLAFVAEAEADADAEGLAGPKATSGSAEYPSGRCLSRMAAFLLLVSLPRLLGVPSKLANSAIAGGGGSQKSLTVT